MNTGTVKTRALTKAGESLVCRAPEAMAVYRPAAGETRLFLEFGSYSKHQPLREHLLQKRAHRLRTVSCVRADTTDAHLDGRRQAVARDHQPGRGGAGPRRA